MPIFDDISEMIEMKVQTLTNTPYLIIQIKKRQVIIFAVNLN